MSFNDFYIITCTQTSKAEFSKIHYSKNTLGNNMSLTLF